MRRRSGLIGLVLAVVGADLRPAAGDAPLPTGMVTIETLVGVAAEGGSPGMFRVRRDSTQGELVIGLGIAGDARPGKDYEIRGVSAIDAARGIVTFQTGQTAVDLPVQAVDDVAAEADETIVLTLHEAEGYRIDAGARTATVTIPRNDCAVTTTADGGEGSLRQAILNAMDLDGSHTVTFDTTVGPFATKQTIVLTEDLPDLRNELTIDGYIEGRLWQATGVTVSGNDRRRVFNVVSAARVVIRSLTVADGRAKRGGGVANAGRLIVRGVTFLHNRARREGGGLANLGGTLSVINSTLVGNSARRAGGGLVNRKGSVTVTHGTFTNNTAKVGGGLFSDGRLLVRNTILANSGEAADCVARGSFDPAGTHNLIESNDGCGVPIVSRDPRLAELGDYNGPVPTIPLGGASPAINLGDNDAALDENGQPLQWDQRGNGDPRVVAGFADIGAFETQAWPTLRVDTYEDTELRACTGAGIGTCSLRGAIMLANSTSKADVITFDPRVFSEPRTIVLKRPLPVLSAPITIDGGDSPGVTVRAAGPFKVFQVVPGIDVVLTKIVTNDGEPAPAGAR